MLQTGVCGLEEFSMLQAGVHGGKGWDVDVEVYSLWKKKEVQRELYTHREEMLRSFSMEMRRRS